MLTLRRSGRTLLLRCVAATLVLAIASGCSNGPDTDFGANDPSLVVALGDSITFGVKDGGIDSCDDSYRTTVGFCPRLQALSGKNVVNEGDCGENSASGLERVGRVLRNYQPGVLLIDYSPNDIVLGVEGSISNLRAMIAEARANQTIPILGTLTPAVGDHETWEPFIEEVNARILALCREENVMCADHHKAFTEDGGFLSSPYALLDEDGLHPNAAGYMLMAWTWHNELSRLY